MHAETYMRETAAIAEQIDHLEIERLALALSNVRDIRGRVFIIGLGGSLANAEHAACDLRKLCEIEAYAPNTAELSAWQNDAGDGRAFSGHLRWLAPHDAVLVLSVGGGTFEVSRSLSVAVGAAQGVGAKVFGIVGPDGGFTGRNATIVIKVPAAGKHVTPHTEAFQAVVWHCLVSHPILQRNATKW